VTSKARIDEVAVTYPTTQRSLGDAARRAWRASNARATHPVHVVKLLPASAMAEYDRPVGIGDLVTVDTTTPVDVPAVAAQVRRLHAKGRG
jgi:hypothetical protein